MGLFEPLVELGDMVQAGQPAARVHLPETPWAEPVTAHFARDGFVLCKRVPGRTCAAIACSIWEQTSRCREALTPALSHIAGEGAERHVPRFG